jgi:hypothetical protein
LRIKNNLKIMYDDDQVPEDEIGGEDLLDGKRSKKLPIDDDMADVLDEEDLADAEEDADEEDL